MVKKEGLILNDREKLEIAIEGLQLFIDKIDWSNMWYDPANLRKTKYPHYKGYDMSDVAGAILNKIKYGE